MYKLKSFYKSRPVLANSISGFVIFCSGDIISQYLPSAFALQNGNAGIEALISQRIDWRRAIYFGGLGIGMNGITLTIWYKLLDKFVGSSMLSHKTVFAKMIADQIVYAPFSIVVYFWFASYLESLQCAIRSGSVIDDCCDRLNKDLVSTWISDCMVWPPANFVNFRYVGLNYRPTFVGVVQVFWQSYLSYVSHKTKVPN